MKHIFFCLALVLFAASLSADIPFYSFDDLVSIDQNTEAQRDSAERRARIRGFLYRHDDGEFILAAEPDLRSCCIGHGAKNERQIFVKGLASAPVSSRALTLEGILKVGKHDDPEGISSSFYMLDEAEIVPQAPEFIYRTIVVLCLVLLVLSYIAAKLQNRE